MSQFNFKKVMPRYSFIAILMTLLATTVVGKAFYVMTAEKDFWLEVADMIKEDSVPIRPNRGNIFSSDGTLMVSSLPMYQLHMDFGTLHRMGNDSLWLANLDSICNGLHNIFPKRSAAEFRELFGKGMKSGKTIEVLGKELVDYNTYKEVLALPVFNMNNKGRSGFYGTENNARTLLYGSLASRTLGKLYGKKDSAQYGLELSFDSLLRGKEGIEHRRKVLHEKIGIIDTPPVDGCDIVTTIDVDMQDLAERSVVDELKKINGDVGVAIVMEVATGDIKAIVNMEKGSDGEYYELKNHAVSDLLEPGSVFKTASIMVALDDGVVDTTAHVETGGGVWPMYGRPMRDHNWRKGGYGTLSLPQVLMFSSNIGVSRIIDKYYHDCPEKFVEGIYRLGLHDDLNLPIMGSSPAQIRMPKKDSRGKQYLNWSKTALPWMSIGYETQVPPISTLTFYNAIANGGKMVKPRFVKQVLKDGEVIKEYPTEVMRESICKPSTLGKIQTILRKVVSEGLGKRAGSTSFAVSGKTGTAQISQGAAGYKSGKIHYLLSFAGYFPSDKPRYSCVVCIQKSGLPASGGGMSGLVFHNIAEGIMAQSIKLDVRDAREPYSSFVPDVKDGNILAADYVLSQFGFDTHADWSGSYAAGNPIWGKPEKSKDGVRLKREKVAAGKRMPDLTGMGARDAVYLVESMGLRSRISGRGKVVGQSIAYGQNIRKGMVCQLTLR